MLLKLSQVAAQLNVTVKYLRTLRQSGALPVVRLGRRALRVHSEDLDHLVAELRARSIRRTAAR